MNPPRNFLLKKFEMGEFYMVVSGDGKADLRRGCSVRQSLSGQDRVPALTAVPIGNR